MNTKNFLLGGIVGGIVYFLLGWLLYGNLMHQYFKDHPGLATNVDRVMDEFVWWALALGNLLAGFLLAYIFSKAGVTTLASGLITGGVIGLLMSASMDCITYATTNMISKHTAVADICTFTVMSAVTGAVVGAVMGMGRSKAVTT